MIAPNEVRLRTGNPWIAVRNPRSSAAQSVGRIGELRPLRLRNWARGTPSVPLDQNSALPVVRGKGSTSRMLETPVKYMIRRSKPKPKPAWGVVPNLRSSKYHQ